MFWLLPCTSFICSGGLTAKAAEEEEEEDEGGEDRGRGATGGELHGTASVTPRPRLLGEEDGGRELRDPSRERLRYSPPAPGPAPGPAPLRWVPAPVSSRGGDPGVSRSPSPFSSLFCAGSDSGGSSKLLIGADCVAFIAFA